MHAFGLEECGDYAHAEQVARAALAPGRVRRAGAPRDGPCLRDDRARRRRRALDERALRPLERRHRRRHALLVAPGVVPSGAGPVEGRARALRPARARRPLERDRRPDRCLCAAVAHRAARRRRGHALGRARRRLGAAHRRRLLQLQRPARDAGLRRRARLAARRRLERALRRGRSLPTRHGADDAAARPARVPRADRVRARRQRARDHAARQPAGAGAPARRQPCAARRAEPDLAPGASNARAVATTRRRSDRRRPPRGAAGSAPDTRPMRASRGRRPRSET